MCTYSNQEIDHKIRNKADSYSVQNAQDTANNAQRQSDINSSEINALNQRVEMLVQVNRDLIQLLLSQDNLITDSEKLEYILNKIY